MAIMSPPRLHDEIDRLFAEISPHAASPEQTRPSALLESWASYVLQLALPGIDPKTLEIEVVARQVTVRGRYHLPEIEAASSVWSTMPAGAMEQVCRVPEEVDGDRAAAQYERGILTITLPKVAYLKPSSIPVRLVP